MPKAEAQAPRGSMTQDVATQVEKLKLRALTELEAVDGVEALEE